MNSSYNINGQNGGALNLLKVKPRALAGQLGLDYSTLIRYVDANPKYMEQMNLINNAVLSGKKGELYGLPILDRYMTLNFIDPNDSNINTNYHKFFSETIIINVSASPKIERNVVIGIDNSVKEFISSSDFDIEISGSIAGKNSYIYDDESLQLLLYIVNTKTAIDITNVYLNNFYKVNNIVIYEYSIMQSPDMSNMLFFTLKCWSDDPANDMISQLNK